MRPDRLLIWTVAGLLCTGLGWPARANPAQDLSQALAAGDSAQVIQALRQGADPNAIADTAK